MLDQTRTPFSYLLISGVMDLGCMFGLLFWKVKTQAYNFHEEWKTQIYRFQIQNLVTKEKSESILQSSPNTAQNFTHSWSSKRQNDVKFGGGTIRQLQTTFMGSPAQLLMLVMTFLPDKSLRAIHHVHQKHYLVF
jgi:hypothetical protein